MHKDYDEILSKCYKCEIKFDYNDPMPFFTIVIKNRIKRCCPKCFSEFKEFALTMG